MNASWSAVAAATAFHLWFIWRMVRGGQNKKGGSCCYRSPKAVRARSSLDLPLIGRLEIFGRSRKSRKAELRALRYAFLNPMPKHWPMVPLAEVLTQDQAYIDAPEPKEYPKLSVKLYGKGVVLDAPADGASLKMQRHQIAKSGQVILSEIWGKKGAIGLRPARR